MYLLSVILIIATIAIISYTPAVYWCIRYKIAEKRFERNLKPMFKLHSENIIITTERLGEGTEYNGNITFEQALKNQEIAVKSTLRLIENF